MVKLTDKAPSTTPVKRFSYTFWGVVLSVLVAIAGIFFFAPKIIEYSQSDSSFLEAVGLQTEVPNLVGLSSIQLSQKLQSDPNLQNLLDIDSSDLEVPYSTNWVVSEMDPSAGSKVWNNQSLSLKWVLTFTDEGKPFEQIDYAKEFSESLSRSGLEEFRLPSENLIITNNGPGHITITEYITPNPDLILTEEMKASVSYQRVEATRAYTELALKWIFVENNFTQLKTITVIHKIGDGSEDKKYIFDVQKMDKTCFPVNYGDGVYMNCQISEKEFNNG